MSLTHDQALELQRTARNLWRAEADLIHLTSDDPADPNGDYTGRGERYLDALADHRTSVDDGFSEYDERPDLVVDDIPAGQAAADAELLRKQVADGTGIPHRCCYGEDVNEEAEDEDEGYHFMVELFGDADLVAAAREGDFIHHGKGLFVVKERVTDTRLLGNGGHPGGVIVRAYGIPTDLVHLDRVRTEGVTTRHDARCTSETLGEWAERHGYTPPEGLGGVILPKCHPECEVLARAKAFGSTLATKLGGD